MEHALSASATSEARTSSARVLWTVAVLALIALCTWVVVDHRAKPVDGAALLAEWFEGGAAPAGFEIAEAAVLPRGDEIVRLARKDARDEAPRIELAELAPGEERERFDWSQLAIGPADTPPVELVIARIPVEVARDELDSLFRSGRELRGDYKSIEDEGGKRVLERGDIAWGSLAPRYVHEREFEPGGTFRDTLRVNLSSATTPLVLLARWPRGMPASKLRVESSLASLRPALP